MLNNLIKLFPLGTIALSIFSLTSDRVLAAPLDADLTQMQQVTNVNQLRDVNPSDWAYEALRSLVDRYGCIAGFPDQTYRGSQPLSRYEFAAGLNSCLNQIERLIASSESLVKEDIDTIKRLTTEFEAELATIGGRVDDLENRTAFLEDHSFSTTTKLGGEIYNYVLGTFGDEKPDGTDIDDQITFSSVVRLNFDSSFQGDDLLKIRLQARNVTSPAVSGGNNALALNLEGDSDNQVELEALFYRFPINEKISAIVGANGMDVDDVFNVASTMGLAYDALSLYSLFNNLVYDNANGARAALGLYIQPSDWISLDIGYWAANPANPQSGSGLFNGNYATGANVNFSFLEDRLNLAVAYLRAYQSEGSGYDLAGYVGTDAATDPFSDRSNASNNYSLTGKYQILDTLAIGGYFGYATASVLGDDADADILTWNAYLTYTDLFKEGSTFIVSFGQPPSLIDSSGDALESDPDSPYILNVEYQYKLNDYIQITPGGYALFNPNGDSDNSTIYVGTLRTIFRY